MAMDVAAKPVHLNQHRSQPSAQLIPYSKTDRGHAVEGWPGSGICRCGGGGQQGHQGNGPGSSRNRCCRGAKVARWPAVRARTDDTAARLTELGAPDVLPIPTDLNSRTDIDAAFAIMANAGAW